jgi:hypothetical protein
MSLLFMYAITTFFVAGMFRAAELSGLINDLNSMWFGSSPVIGLLLTPIFIKNIGSAVKVIGEE